MADTDTASAARRVAEPVTPQRAASYAAEIARAFFDMDEVGETLPIRKDALVALLPVLDAVAAGPDGDRVERWARAMCEADGSPPDVTSVINRVPFWKTYAVRAEAAIALADAEGGAKGDRYA